MRYWLMKSEPGDCSIDDLAALPEQTVAWYGVRNYQARNFMRDQMSVGDAVLFYHSNCKEPGIAGIAKVSSTAYPDAKQFERNSKYFDPKATQETPRWFNVDVRLARKTRPVSIKELAAHSGLSRTAITGMQKARQLLITFDDSDHPVLRTRGVRKKQGPRRGPLRSSQYR